MPDFFVDGYREGKTSSALYVQADNADAALVRAAQLGMEGTGVCSAKDLTAVEPQSRNHSHPGSMTVLKLVFLRNSKSATSGACHWI